MRKFTFDQETVQDIIHEGGVGLCKNCGAEHYGVEPDAEGYECEECGENAVTGFENLVLDGTIEIFD